MSVSVHLTLQSSCMLHTDYTASHREISLICHSVNGRLRLRTLLVTSVCHLYKEDSCSATGRIAFVLFLSRLFDVGTQSLFPSTANRLYVYFLFYF